MLFKCEMSTATFHFSLNYIQTTARMKQIINHQHLAHGSVYKRRMRKVIGILLSSKLKLDSEQSSDGKEGIDPQKVMEILDFKLENIYPPNATKNKR